MAASARWKMEATSSSMPSLEMPFAFSSVSTPWISQRLAAEEELTTWICIRLDLYLSPIAY
jgi:hypothetical protein